MSIDITVKDKVNKTLLNRILEHQKSLKPLYEERKLIRDTKGSEEYNLSRIPLAMLKMVFELLESDELTDDQRNTLRTIMDPKHYVEVQVKTIPTDFIDLHKKYFNYQEIIANMRSLYFYSRKLKTNKNYLSEYATQHKEKEPLEIIKSFCSLHTGNAIHWTEAEKRKFFITGENKSASG